MKQRSSARVIIVFGCCSGIVVGLGMINIWLGVLALPIFYEMADSLTR